MRTLPRSRIDHSLVIRTDFSDERAWQRVHAAIVEPQRDGWAQANVDFIDDPAFDGLTNKQLLALDPEALGHVYIYLVDSTTIAHDEHPVLVVEVYLLEDEVDAGIELGRSFRVIPSEMWAVENNLSLANADWEDFTENLDDDGIYRGVGE